MTQKRSLKVSRTPSFSRQLHLKRLILLTTCSSGWSITSIFKLLTKTEYFSLCASSFESLNSEKIILKPLISALLYAFLMHLKSLIKTFCVGIVEFVRSSNKDKILVLTLSSVDVLGSSLIVRPI